MHTRVHLKSTKLTIIGTASENITAHEIFFNPNCTIIPMIDNSIAGAAAASGAAP